MAVAFDDSFFNINFVRVIESRPCIWNYNLQEYSKRNVTEKAWVEIAKEVNDTVPNCRERWRNIRTAFLRSLKAPPSGSGKNSKKKYYLSQCLEFLLPYTKSKNHKGNLEALVKCSLDDVNSQIAELPEGNKTDKTDNLRTHSPKLSISSRFVTEEFTETDTDEIIISPRHPYKKKKICHQTSTNSSKSTQADDAFIEWLKQKKGKDNAEENPNLFFLRSLLPDMMRMTDKQNRRFRQKVIGLMDDILEDADINTQTCSSSGSNATTSTNESVRKAMGNRRTK
ncbi:uncharacterized protein [Diabrotica undecimpunctata]|uniref:uncharacterized protein n=1 Tax=Diabrotica undecimpunctata TaxID=50387 RepID=UPI003B634278